MRNTIITIIFISSTLASGAASACQDVFDGTNTVTYDGPECLTLGSTASPEAWRPFEVNVHNQCETPVTLSCPNNGCYATVIAVGEMLMFNSGGNALDWDIDGVTGRADVTVQREPSGGGCTKADVDPIGAALGCTTAPVNGSPSGSLGLLLLVGVALVMRRRQVVTR